MQVQKRNGAIVPFDHTKIEQAVSSAGLTVDVLCVVDMVVDAIRPLPSPVSVETIQDHVERVLLARGHREIAKAYMAYRDEKTKQRQRRPVSPLTRAAFDEAAKFFPTQLQQFQYFDKYSRFSYPLGRRETWVETVDRSVDYLVELTKATGGPGVVELVSWLRATGRYMMLRMEALPSMRLLAMAGEPARRQNLSIYNCSAIAADCTQAFVEMLVISMAGCGVGFSVENQYVSKLPPVQKQTGETLSHVVGDSVEGWAAALQLGLERWFAGQDVAYDFTAVREAGAPLKTKGGRASGPAPLRRMLTAIRRIILARQGDRLRSLDAHDIACYVGEAAVQGGMRRTAMISLSDSGDTAMVAAKHGSFDPVRWNANNSAVWTTATTDADILEHFIEMHRSRNGERGVFSRAASMGTMTPRRRAAWPTEVGAGVNPCQPGFATVLTPDGIRTFDDIDVGSVIWSGKQWTKVIRKVATGVKPVQEYHTTAGVFVGTDNHRVVQHGRKIEVRDATAIDRVSGPSCHPEKYLRQYVVDGWMLGDGSVHKASNNLLHLCIGRKDGDFMSLGVPALHRPGIHAYAYEVQTTLTYKEVCRTYDRQVPERFRRGTHQQVASFLRGLYSANGSICANRVTLKAASFQVVRQVQEMLSSLGIASYYTTNQPHAVAFSNDAVAFSNGTYTCKRSYDVNITRDRDRFRSLIGFVQKYKSQILDEICDEKKSGGRPAKKTFDIIATVDLGEHPVYDITVEADEHTYWTGGLLVSNCGEIVLRLTGGLCNLSIAVARPDDTVQSLKRKVTAAAIFGTIQSTATFFPGLRPIWKENAERERLLGVDITGQQDCPLLVQAGASLLDCLRAAAVTQNEATAAQLGINPSLATTCIKPSGNSSTLLDCAPGLHARHSAFYVRNVRVSTHSPVYKVLRDAGAPLSPENGQTAENATTWVCSFPCRAPVGATVKADLSAIEQLEYWKKWKLHYTEHNPSVTVTYRDDELVAVTEWCSRNRDILCGVSFLPHSDVAYEQMPYIEITEDEYNQRAATFPTIDWSKLVYHEHEDLTTAAQEIACAAGACLI